MAMKRTISTKNTLLTAVAAGVLLYCATARPTDLDLAKAPLFVTETVPPLTLLVMGRDHKLYYEAYNDASDLNGDGTINVGYKPSQIDYYGYFDSKKCYDYGSGRFTPVGAAGTNKTCNGHWSGDFLNYVTTPRIDALRKVFYGGHRSVDTTTQTVLQRAYIPQDAHSWGKEYESVARDGYDITQYTPLSLPPTGKRHLFANTTLSDNGTPLMRVLTNSQYRIWEWVSIERPVAGTECATGNNQRAPCAGGAGTLEYDSHPLSDADFKALVGQFANTPHFLGSQPVTQINGSGDPFGPPSGTSINTQDHYLTIFQGAINAPTTGTYQFAVDGDDAVEVIIDGTVVNGNVVGGTVVASWYDGHGKCTCQTHAGSISLSAGNHTVVFLHEERDGDDNYYLYWKPPGAGSWAIVPATSFSNLTQTVYTFYSLTTSTMTDYTVAVEVCKTGLLEPNCLQYPSGDYKPVGILQQYSQNDRMLFGLLSGSYYHNLSGGVLRKKVGSLSDEIDPNTGLFTSTVGVIGNMDRLRVVGFNYACPYCYTSPPGVVTRPVTEADGQGYEMWGNPIGEMMYEGLRYFAGKKTPTSAYSTGVNGAGTYDTQLGLTTPAWDDPYDKAHGGHDWCAKPFELVLSDIDPSYDTDQLPGTAFGSFSGDLTGLDVSSLANTISSNEPDVAGLHFIGQSGSTTDGACTPKSVSGFGNIRGLCPQEPTKQGGYYSAAVAYYGRTHDLNPVDGGTADQGQEVQTFAVALASPLPHINISVGSQTVTMVPFTKSVGGCWASTAPRASSSPRTRSWTSTSRASRTPMRATWTRASTVVGLTTPSASITRTPNRAPTTTWTPSPSTSSRSTPTTPCP